MYLTANFWKLTLGVFLFMTSFNLIIPELNDFITALDGESYKGLIIGLFTITAAISRPFSGKMSDTIGRKYTMYIGAFVCIILSLFYPFSTSIFFFLTLRLLHGFSTGFFPTGATALVTDILPEHKRGEGMGIYGTGVALGTGVGQIFGSPIASLLSVNGLFVVASVIAVFSIILINSVTETLANPKRLSFDVLKIKREDIIEKSVISPAIVMFLTIFCIGLVLVLTPDMSKFLGIQNKGWYFFLYSVFTILVRLFTGKLSDKIGRRQTLLIGISILIVSMLLTGYSTTVFWFTTASAFFGIGSGIISPAIFAWMADLSPIHRRGISSATIFIALEIGVLAGSVCTLWLYNNTFESLRVSFLSGAIVSGIALVFTAVHLIRYPQSKLENKKVEED